MEQPDRTSKWIECPGSGERQGLSWLPDASGYPGAVVCIYCTYGVLVKRTTVMSNETGIVRRHYINEHEDRMTYRKPQPKRVSKPKHRKD